MKRVLPFFAITFVMAFFLSLSTHNLFAAAKHPQEKPTPQEEATGAAIVEGDVMADMDEGEDIGSIGTGEMMMDQEVALTQERQKEAAEEKAEIAHRTP